MFQESQRKVGIIIGNRYSNSKDRSSELRASVHDCLSRGNSQKSDRIAEKKSASKGDEGIE
jgi:hypothetical protein